MAQNAKVPVSGARGAATGYGYRRSSADDVKRVVFIRQGAEARFHVGRDTSHPGDEQSRQDAMPTVRAIVQKRIADNAANLTELQVLQERMTKARRR